MSGILNKLHLGHNNNQNQLNNQNIVLPSQQTLLTSQSGLPTTQIPYTNAIPLTTTTTTTTSQGVAQPLVSGSVTTVHKQTIVRPAIVEETVRTDILTEIIPVVHREIEQPIVHHIEKHITEAPAPSLGGVVQMAPIIQETVVTRQINEVQPVVHREVARTVVERQEQHLAEKVVAPTQHTRNSTFETIAAAPVLAAAPAVTVSQEAPTILPTINAPVQRSAITKAAIVDETIRTDVITQVQPVVHREVEQPIVHHIEKHITEAPAPSLGGVVKMAPIIQETLHTRQINEVQPVVHREVARTVVERQEQHLAERVAAPVQHTRSSTFETIAAAPVVAAAPAVTVSNAAPTILPTINAPVQRSAITKAAIVDQTVRTDVITEVVPVVHREVEQPIVNHIEKHITEAPAASLSGVVRLAPVVQENVVVTEIDEVQPVIHREAARRVVERQEQHMSEKIVAPAQHTKNTTFETIAAAPVVAAAPAVTVSNAAPTILPTINAPVQTQQIVKSAIVDETIRTDVITQVQPVVHREVEQPIVHHIEKHITEAPAPSLAGVHKLAPVIQETLLTREIDEVQPVVHREVARAVVERQEQHISERIVAPAQHTKNSTFETIAAAPVVAKPAVTVSSAAPTILPTIAAPTVSQQIVKPTIVDQTVRTDVITQVQPVVHREVDQAIVNHIEKHITEAPAPSLAGVHKLAPVVQETLLTREIDEVQPVVHRQAAQVIRERTEEHISERIVAPTQHTHAVVVEPAILPVTATTTTTTTTTATSAPIALGKPVVAATAPAVNVNIAGASII